MNTRELRDLVHSNMYELASPRHQAKVLQKKLAEAKKNHYQALYDAFHKVLLSFLDKLKEGHLLVGIGIVNAVWTLGKDQKSAPEIKVLNPAFPYPGKDHVYFSLPAGVGVYEIQFHPHPGSNYSFEKRDLRSYLPETFEKR